MPAYHDISELSEPKQPFIGLKQHVVRLHSTPSQVLLTIPSSFSLLQLFSWLSHVLSLP